MAVTRLCTYIETLFTDIGYIFTNVSNGCDKNWIRELIKMSQTLLMFSLMLQPLLIQYVSNGCDKIAVTAHCQGFEVYIVTLLKRKPWNMKIFSNFAKNGPIWKISKLGSPWHHVWCHKPINISFLMFRPWIHMAENG